MQNYQHIYIVDHKRTGKDKQVYMQSFCEAWKQEGGEYIFPPSYTRRRLCRHFLKIWTLTRLYHRKHTNAYIICARGGHLLKSSIPYLFHGDIVPMLWDCWAPRWDQLEHELRFLKCKLCFITQSDTVREMQRRLPHIHFVHIPEGVCTEDYIPGKPLAERTIDVYEMGRKHNYYHRRLIDDKLEEHCNFIYKADYKDKNVSLVFSDWSVFTQKLADTKIAISFPNSMTNPKQKWQTETLTMRYWEQMLSRCIIVGHCPTELSKLIGYNPVIEADFADPCGQIKQILSHIEDYQELVDKNREAALKFAPWTERMSIIFNALENK